MLSRGQARGNRAGKERVRKLMKAHGLCARGKRKFKATTNSAHDLPVSPNLLERQFSVDTPNRVWTGDITYLWTEEGWVYLAVVIDLFSRQIVGFAMSERMTRRLVIDALRMAWFRRRPTSGLIFHSDRGSQYASGDFQKQLSAFGMRGSMSRKGDVVTRIDHTKWKSLACRLEILTPASVIASPASYVITVFAPTCCIWFCTAAKFANSDDES